MQSRAALILVPAILLAGVFLAFSAGQETANKITIDAATPAPPAAPLPFILGGRSLGRSLNGHVLAANSRYLTFDGKPWFPVMGEFHYTRFPAEGWNEELLKMKAGGVRIVSTYVFWIHHEEVEGEFDWSGRRDLRRFVELCAANGLYAWIRIGPWAHGEVRNGGFPDWLVAKAQVRRNDPAYLRYVTRFYGEIAKQLNGLYWKDGGPIVGIQLENEYHSRGTGRGAEHIETLQQIAIHAGMDPPFWTETAWDDAAIPARGILPIFSGYADAFWTRQLTELPPNANFFFTGIRCDENVNDVLRPLSSEVAARYTGFPFLTAEMGGGMEAAYHRRPLIAAEDTAAMELVKLGSGVSLYGFYMFHGGVNPEGRLSTLQESQATGYPQDLPVKSYDYQAPLGQAGQMTPAFRETKIFHLFLHDFGAELAPMVPYRAAREPVSRQDRDTPRVSFRGDGNRGFVFINNYQRNYPLPERRNFHVEVKLASGAVDVPRNPIAIPSGAYTFWPVDLPVGRATLEYATAQPLAKLDDPQTFVFFAWPGVEPEFAFRDQPDLAIDAPKARVRREEGRVYVDRIAAGTDPAICVGGIQILVLSRQQARDLWKATLGGRDRLVLSSADLYFDRDRIHLRSQDPSRLGLSIYPAPEAGIAGLAASGHDGIFESYTAKAIPIAAAVEVRKLSEAGQAPPVKMGREVATAPAEADFAAAARWSIHIPNAKPDAILRISYRGDVARLYAGGKLIADDFYKGTPFTVGLKYQPETDFELQVLPLRQDAPIYLPPSARLPIAAGGQVAELDEVRAEPAYEAVATVDNSQPFVMDHRAGAGSLADVSFLLDAPAGKHGFIRVHNGHLATAGGQRARFWGVHLTDWSRGSVELPSKEDAPMWAATLARFGVNIVRLHFLDLASPRGIVDSTKPDSRSFDPAQLDRLDYLFAELKKRGIYADLNLNVGRSYKAGDGVRDFDKIQWAKGLTLYDPRLIELEKDYARQLLTHVNPYTGLEYRNDPAIAIVEILNENGLYLGFRAPTPYYDEELTGLYNDWLRRNLSPEALAKVRELAGVSADAPVPRLKGPEVAAAPPERYQAEMTFYMDTETRFYQDMSSYLKDTLDVKVPITGTADHSHSSSGYPMLVSLAKLDILDGHVYWQHPGSPPPVNTPMVNDPLHSTVVQLSRTAFAGKPYTVSETNHPFPNDYAAEGIPIIAAYAGFQDWDAVIMYTFEPKRDPAWKPYVGDPFDISLDPVRMTEMATGALMFLRGDIRPARETVARTYSKQQVLDSRRLRNEAPYFTPGFPLALPLQHAVRIASLDGPPTAVYNAAVENPIRSDTGELAWYTAPEKSGVVTVETDRTQALIGFIGANGKTLKNLSARIENPFAAVVLSSMDGEPLARSARMLLTTGSRVSNTGMKWNEAHTRLASQGESPSLIEPVTGSVVLRGLAGAAAVNAMPLDGAGHAIGTPIAAAKNADGWTLPLGTRTTPWYAISVKW